MREVKLIKEGYQYTGLPRSLKNLQIPVVGKSKFQAEESPWIWVALLENPGMGKSVAPLTAKYNQNELFVMTGHNTFNVTMFENKNEGSIFPQK